MCASVSEFFASPNKLTYVAKPLNSKFAFENTFQLTSQVKSQNLYKSMLKGS